MDYESESEAADAAPEFAIETHGRPSTVTPHARDFDALALVLKIVGGPTVFVASLLLLGRAWQGLVVMAVGSSLLAIAYGLNAFKMWAWYATVVVMPPIAVIFSIISLFEWRFNTLWFLYTGFPVFFCGYVGWVLFSKGGRTRYRAACEARRRAKANPDSLAGRMYRRRR